MTSIQDTDKNNPDNTHAELPEALQEDLQTLKNQFHAIGKSTLDDVIARCEIGSTIEKVKNTKTYGKNAVELLAKKLGRSPKTLYKYAEVTKAWGKHELEALLKRKNRHGEPVSWSHLTALRNVEADERDRLIELALADGLSVREMTAYREKKENASSSQAEGADSKAQPGQDGATALQEVVEMFDALTALVPRLESLFEHHGDDGDEHKLKMAGLREQALKANENIIKIAEQNIKGIQRLGASCSAKEILAS